MASTDAISFWTVFSIIFFINLVVPVVSVGIGTTATAHDYTEIETEPPGVGDIVTFTGLNVLLVPFWTFGLPFWLNIVVMIPLRALAWYLILRMIRGN